MKKKFEAVLEPIAITQKMSENLTMIADESLFTRAGIVRLAIQKYLDDHQNLVTKS